MDPLVEGVHDPSLGEFPRRESLCGGWRRPRESRRRGASLGGRCAGKRMGLAQGNAGVSQWRWLLLGLPAGGDHRANASLGTASVRYPGENRRNMLQKVNGIISFTEVV